MQFTSIFTILSAAMAVSALPAAWDSGSGSSGGDSSSTCAKGSAVSCCDTDSSDSGLLGNVLGGSCSLGLISLLGNTCPAGNTFCCPTNQDGTLNIALSCIPINL